MKEHRWQLLTLLLALAPGRGSQPAAAATTTTRRAAAARRRRDGETAERGVSGSISVMAVWTGAEQAVVPGRARRLQGGEPRRRRQLHLGRRPAADAALDRGRGRQPARHRRCSPQPGLMRDFADQGRAAAARLRRATTSRRTSASRRSSSARSTARSTASSSRRPTSRPSGTTSPPSRTRASSRPRPGTTSSRRPRRSRRPACPPTRSAAPTAGRSPTCSRTSTCARPARRSTTSSSTHEIPWTDQSVKDALTEMAKVFGDTDNIAGGHGGRAADRLPDLGVERLRRRARRRRR